MPLCSCVYVCDLYVVVYVPHYKCGGQRTNLWICFFLHIFLWILGMKLKLPGLCGKCLFLLSHLSNNWHTITHAFTSTLWHILFSNHWLVQLHKSQIWKTSNYHSLCEFPTLPLCASTWVSAFTSLSEYEFTCAFTCLCWTKKQSSWNLAALIPLGLLVKDFNEPQIHQVG